MDAASLESELLCSSDLQPSADVNANTLAEIPAKASAKGLANVQEKDDEEKDGEDAWDLKRKHSLLVFPAEVTASVHHKRRYPCIPEVQQYYYQINWPQAVLQKWATEKADKERRLSLTISQDAATIGSNIPEPAPEEPAFGCREAEAKNGDSQYHNTQT